MLSHAPLTLSSSIRLLQSGYADGALDGGFSEEGGASGVPPISLSGRVFCVGTRFREGRPLRRGYLGDLGLQVFSKSLYEAVAWNVVDGGQIPVSLPFEAGFVSSEDKYKGFQSSIRSARIFGHSFKGHRGQLARRGASPSARLAG